MDVLQASHGERLDRFSEAGSEYDEYPYPPNIDTDAERFSSVESTELIEDTLRFGVRKLKQPYVERKELSELIEYVKQPSTIIITGSHGAGKTNLVTRCLQTDSILPRNAIWINAENRSTISESFRNFRKELDTDIRVGCRPDGYIFHLVPFIYRYLKEKDCILVFDNATDLETIKDFLTEEVLNTDIKNRQFTLIITSTNENAWDSSKLKCTILKMDNFSNDESLEFLKNSLRLSSYINNDEKISSEVIRLTRKVENNPLTLRLSAAYVMNSNESQNDEDKLLTLKIFLSDVINKVSLCNRNYPNEIFRNCVQSIIDRIKKSESYPDEALEILTFISYMNQNHIPGDIFLREIAGNDVGKLTSILNILEKYSLVSLEQGFIYTNSLTQEVIRRNAEIENKEGKTISTILRILHKHFLERQSISGYISHIVSLWNHVYAYKLTTDFITGYIVDSVNLVEYFLLVFNVRSNEIIEDLISALEDINGKAMSKLIKKKEVLRMTRVDNQSKSLCNKSDWTALHRAAKSGNVDYVMRLLKKGFDVHARTEYEFTPLHVSAQYGNADVAKILLDCGSNVNCTTNLNYTPLHIAVREHHMDVIKILLDNKNIDVNIETKYQITALHFAARDGMIHVVKMLLGKGANVNTGDTGHFTALHYAAFKGHLDVVSELLKYNPKLNLQTTRGNTALHLAAESGHKDVVKLLLANDVDVSIVNENSQTAADMAHEDEPDIKEMISEYDKKKAKKKTEK